MAETKWIAVAVVRGRLLEILDSIDERVKESEETQALLDINDPDNDYHVGRKESLEVTKQQILNLFASELI